MANFTFYTIETAPDDAKPMLEQVQQGFGFVHNLFAYMAEAPTAVEAYLALNGIIAKTSFTPAQQQIALLATSVENGCGFCSVAHRAGGKMKKAKQQTLDAVNENQAISDASDAALVKFTQEAVRLRGNLPDESVDEFLAAGFTKQQVFELMIIIAIKTLSNYTNHLTHPEPNEELLAAV